MGLTAEIAKIGGEQPGVGLGLCQEPDTAGIHE